MTMTIISRRRVPVLAAFALLWLSAPALPQVMVDARTITHRMLPSVVTIKTFDRTGQPIATGSGFVVSANGLIVTNYHVIDKADDATAVFNNGSQERVQGVISIDRDKDFAILKVNAVDLPVAPLGNSEQLEQGEPLVAIGAPLGLSNTVTAGIVSEIRVLEGRRMIQHTAAISPGSSGGPLINSAGQVVGINTFLLKGGQSLFFALPINYVRAALQNTNRQVVDLASVHQYVAKQEEQEKADRLKKFLHDNFDPYDDAEHLFTAMAPREWQMQRSESFDKDQARDVVVIFYPREAEQVHINGWLSAGIRVHLHFPPQGRMWNTDYVRSWQLNYMDSVQRADTTQKVSKPELAKVGNVNATALLALSEAKIISKPELAWVYVSGTQQCLMSVEIVAPADQKDDLELVQSVFEASFRANWVR